MDKTMPPQPAPKNHKKPHRYTQQGWDSNYVREACEKSMAALESSKALLDTSGDGGHGHGLSHLIRVKNVENLFFINNKGVDYTLVWWSINDASMVASSTGREWGSRDIMLDLGIHGCLTCEQRSEYLRDAASFSGGAVYLLELYNLPEEEASDWLQALSMAADRDAEPRRLFIRNCRFKTVDLLKTLRKCKALRDLSLQFWESITDDCVEMLSGLPAIATLHIDQVKVSPDFVGKLADLRPTHSPLAASLQRLDIHAVFTEVVKPAWARRSFSGFLKHWPKLEELTLIPHSFTEEDLMDFMDLLAQSKKTDNTPASPTARLYSLTLGKFPDANLELRRTVAAVVDGLSQSGLPFLELEGVHKMDPAIEAQLLKNQRLFLLGDYLEKVPANSMRLFICGDPYAGKTTLLSTMHSMHSRKRAKLRGLCTCGGIKPNRTQGIEVRSIKKDGIRVSLWDMAGQPEFHAFHDCMFPDIGTSSYQTPSMFMFVWSPMHSETSKKGRKKEIKEFEDSFRYWLKFLASKSRQSNVALKVILVLTRMDQMELVARALSSSINSLRSEFREVIHIVNPTLEVDARRRDSVKPVLECIFHTAKEMLQGVEVYDICTQVSEHLSKHMKTSMQRIIRWSEFRDICEHQLSIPHDEAKLKTIALSLNESGIIIYVNNIAHIVLDPNWFCNQLIGSLIYLAESKRSKGTMEIRGFTHRDFLEVKLESITESQVKGSLLVELMEAMHLCCKVPNNLNDSTSNGDRLFIPTTLTDSQELNVGLKQLQWRSSTSCSYDNTYTYMGRRLECENKELTFLTPGLFPRIQVLLNNEFQDINGDADADADVALGKEFISICMLDVEIIVVFCQGQADHVIDVLMRTQNNNKVNVGRSLAYVVQHIIDTLIRVCAQPRGNQGVKLIESVIRPGCLENPSTAHVRQDQCLKMSSLKQELKKQLEEGRPTESLCHLWKESRYVSAGTNDPLLDLLGPDDYSKVYKEWLEEVSENSDALFGNEGCSLNRVVSKILSDVYSEVNPEPKDQGDVDVLFMKDMVREILKEMYSLKSMVGGLNDKVDVMHKELETIRNEVLTKIKKDVERFLNLEMGNECHTQLPRFILPMAEGVNKVKKLVTSLMDAQSVRIELCCEDRTSPHQVDGQEGITLFSLSENSLLCKAIPYIDFFLSTLSLIAQVGTGISFGLPQFSGLVHKSTREYPKISTAPGSNPYPTLGKSNNNRYSSQSESLREWRECLAAILRENGGITNENIAKKFLLKRAIYKTDGSNQVVWLCDKHYKRQKPCPLS